MLALMMNARLMLSLSTILTLLCRDVIDKEIPFEMG